MPILSICPYCNHRVNVPDRALAASLKCPACKSWYTVTGESKTTLGLGSATAASPGNQARDPFNRGLAAATAATPPKPVAVSSPSPTQAKSRATPVASARALAAAATALPLQRNDDSTAPPVDDQPAIPTSLLVVNMDLGTAPEGQEVTAEGWQPHLLGLLGCILGGSALITANLSSTTGLTRPLSGVGLAIGLVAIIHAASDRAIRLLFPIAGTVLSAMTLLIAFINPSLLGPRYEVSREKSGQEYNPEAVQVIPLDLSSQPSELLEIDGWADARKAAVQQGPVKVMVTGASIGPVKVVGSQPRSTKSSYLAITVRVQHLGHGGDFRFVHWGEKTERTVPAAIATCKGNQLSPADLSPDAPVGVNYGHQLFPGQAVNDLLLFTAPTGSEAVRLELPGEAWNGHTSFRFQIPATMITRQ